MKTTEHRLPSGIVATVQMPDDQIKSPVIILCHGFCGIKEILLPAFAERFVEAGFATVAFDYHGFGASDGERGRLVPAQQIEDILDVVTWAASHAEFDPRRIALWGTSLGGCHVIAAAAANPLIKCVVSQLAFADGDTIVTGSMSEEDRLGFVETLDRMAKKRDVTGKEMMVSITKVLTDPESRAFFDQNKATYPEMDIKIPFLTVRETLLYKPLDNASRVTCPTLVVVASKDTVNPPEQGVALYEGLTISEKALWIEEGAKHYDVYQGEHFSNVVTKQLEWFEQHL